MFTSFHKVLQGIGSTISRYFCFFVIIDLKKKIILKYLVIKSQIEFIINIRLERDE